MTIEVEGTPVVVDYDEDGVTVAKVGDTVIAAIDTSEVFEPGHPGRWSAFYGPGCVIERSFKSEDRALQWVRSFSHELLALATLPLPDVLIRPLIDRRGDR